MSSWNGDWMRIPTACAHCGAPLRQRDPQWPGSGPPARFCSGRCRAAAHRAAGYRSPPKPPRPPRTVICAVCGSMFPRAGVGRSPRTCSGPCQLIWRRAAWRQAARRVAARRQDPGR
jgi:hypothetical protein